MNFESLEQMRYEATKQVIEAMATIAADPKANLEDRFKAAKIVDRMSDSIIKAYLLTRLNDTNEKQGNKLIGQLDKLVGDEE